MQNFRGFIHAYWDVTNKAYSDDRDLVRYNGQLIKTGTRHEFSPEVAWTNDVVVLISKCFL